MQDLLFILLPLMLIKSTKSFPLSRFLRSLIEPSQHTQPRSLGRQVTCPPTCSSALCRFALLVLLTQHLQDRHQVLNTYVGVFEVVPCQVCSLQIVKEFIPDQISHSPPTVDALGKASAQSTLVDPHHDSVVAECFDFGNLSVCYVRCTNRVNRTSTQPSP